MYSTVVKWQSNNKRSHTQHQLKQPHTASTQTTTHCINSNNHTQHQLKQPYTRSTKTTTHSINSNNHTQHQLKKPHIASTQTTTHRITNKGFSKWIMIINYKWSHDGVHPYITFPTELPYWPDSYKPGPRRDLITERIPYLRSSKW